MVMYMLMEFPHDSADFPRPLPRFFSTLEEAFDAMIDEAAMKSGTTVEKLKLSFLDVPGFDTAGCEVHGCLAFYANGEESSWCDWCLYEITITNRGISAIWADTSPVEEDLYNQIEQLIATVKTQNP